MQKQAKPIVLNHGPHHFVVQKPYNMVIVAGRGAPKPTLLDIMRAEYGPQVRPVHRLDRVTAGCCIFAKDLFGQQALSDAFRKRIVTKYYLAIVEGKPSWKKLRIDARLERTDNPNARKGPLAHQNVTQEGQRALTDVEVLASNDKYTLVLAKPETGRMHQIRAHLAHVGFPIVGDKQYGSKTEFAPFAIALFAHAVSFPAPRGGRVYVKAPLVEEMAQFLKKQNIDATRALSAI